MKNNFFKVLAFLFFAAALMILFPVLHINKQKEKGAKYPHIFLILIDAARFDLVGQVFDSKEITPHINQFSKTACNFTNFYANAPYTGPSVASMLTGLLPEVHTVRNAASQLPPKIKTLPGYLKEIGYKTRLVTGNVLLLRHHFLREFDQVSLIRPLENNDQRKDTSFNDIEKALEKVAALEANVPHFVYFHFLPPHLPYEPPKEMNRLFDMGNSYESKSKKTANPNRKSDNTCDQDFVKRYYKAYLNNAHYADSLVGKLIAALKEKGIFKDSLIIISSDHGEAFTEHGKLGHITTLYREMLHVPFLVKLPNQDKEIVSRAHHSFIDLLPTLANLLNLPAADHCQGQPMDFGTPGDKNQQGFIYARAAGDQLNMAIFNSGYKFIFHAGKEELYRLDNDAGEQNNVAPQNPSLTRHFKTKLFQYLHESLRLKERLKIKAIDREFDDEHFIEELRTLGYL